MNSESYSFSSFIVYLNLQEISDGPLFCAGFHQNRPAFTCVETPIDSQMVSVYNAVMITYCLLLICFANCMYFA